MLTYIEVNYWAIIVVIYYHLHVNDKSRKSVTSGILKTLFTSAFLYLNFTRSFYYRNCDP